MCAARRECWVSCCSLPYSLETLSLNVKFTDLARLANQQAPNIHLFLSTSAGVTDSSPALVV